MCVLANVDYLAGNVIIGRMSWFEFEWMDVSELIQIVAIEVCAKQF